MLALFIVGAIVELAMHVTPVLWRARKVMAACSLVLTAFATGLLTARMAIFNGWNILLAAIVLTSLYRLFNLIRVVEGRMHDQYLRRSTQRTGLVLLGVQLAAALLWLYWSKSQQPRSAQLWALLAVAQLTVAIGILMTTIRTLIKTKHHSSLRHFSDKELPTVTVAIPARNETDELTACLSSVLAGDYPKLEVLVLDDCSQDKTPEIIRSFAHAGVRFIQGAEPAERWLAKNQAYDRLSQEASGEFILFCGVDTRFGRQTIRALVTTALTREKQMVSVLPRRRTAGLAESVVQPMRYWWELTLPRRLFNRPAVLSTCWLIKKEALKHAGGFAAASHAILPEAYFARSLTKADGYSFIRSDELLDVRTVKTLAEQRATTIRTRYPQLRRRPEWVLVLTLGEAVFLLLPFLLAMSGFWLHVGIVPFLAILTSGLLIATNCLVMAVTNRKSWWLGLLTFPLLTITDVVLLHVSMWQYEFSVVDWKGRNICIPVMHVIPKLPNPRELH